MTGAEETPNQATAEGAESEKPAENDKSAEAEPVDLEKLQATFQETAKNYLIEQSRHVIIPSFSKWFDMNTVHLIEKNCFQTSSQRKMKRPCLLTKLQSLTRT